MPQSRDVIEQAYVDARRRLADVDQLVAAGRIRADVEASSQRARAHCAVFAWVLGEAPRSPYSGKDWPTPTEQQLRREWHSSLDVDEGIAPPAGVSRTYGSAVHHALGWVLDFEDYERPN